MGWTSSPARPGYPFHSQQEPEFSMPIFSIDAESCVNCGKCVKICPRRAARGQDHAEIVYREDCQSCFLCIIYCPKQRSPWIPNGTGHARALLKTEEGRVRALP
ncbi:MAG: ATP-binding protein [Bilophila wadsworthia]